MKIQRKRSKTGFLIQPLLFGKGQRTRQVTNQAELKTGSAHLQQQGTQGCSSLSTQPVYRLYLRPHTVPSRWDSARTPGDFSPSRLTLSRGQPGPSRVQSAEAQAGRGRGRLRRGRVMQGTSTLPPPPPPRLKFPPTQEELPPSPKRGSHSNTPTPAARSPQGVSAKALKAPVLTSFQIRRPEEESLAQDAQLARRSYRPHAPRATPRCKDRSGHCLQSAHAYLFLDQE